MPDTKFVNFVSGIIIVNRYIGLNGLYFKLEQGHRLSFSISLK